MTGGPVYIVGMGIVSALGCGLDETYSALLDAKRALSTASPFLVSANRPLPVGATAIEEKEGDAPRTHRLACLAAEQAVAGCSLPPDAIVLGSTTGGILTTEALFEQGVDDRHAYRHHALGAIGEELARRCGCSGPVITVSTACSSGAVAIKLALEMLRSGQYRRVLAGGADSLCRLTYFGFNALQLVDPDGAHPLDCDRRGMSVAEGAAMLLLALEPADTLGLQIAGAGLSCDAYHATTPHPDGAGALAAMQAALDDAGLSPTDIDYINLHGTGTPDNDRSEARAVRALFPCGMPPVSSIKGATGHSLAAAGAIEAVIAALCIERGLLPANVGYRTYDPELGVVPIEAPEHRSVAAVLSNSFGFGGNNAALIVARSGTTMPPRPATADSGLKIVGKACLTGAGHLGDTTRAFFAGRESGKLLPDGPLTEGLPPRLIRRLKRLPKMALALAMRACEGIAPECKPAMVSMGTAWGALSETHDFLQRLIETGQQYPSPTDFIGSVHNAPAGQIAMFLGAKGANVTTSGGDYSFEQALLSAQLISRQSGDAVLVVGADEYHPLFSPRFDPSAGVAGEPADGGGALLLQRGSDREGVRIALAFYRAAHHPDVIGRLIDALGGAEAIGARFGALLVGLPAAVRPQAQPQLERFMDQSRYQKPAIDYRRRLGEFASASAVAAVLAAEMVAENRLPAALSGLDDTSLGGKGVLLLGLGDFVTAMEIHPS